MSGLSLVPGSDPGKNLEQLKQDYEVEYEKFNRAALIVLPTEKLLEHQQRHFTAAAKASAQTATSLKAISFISKILLERKNK